MKERILEGRVIVVTFENPAGNGMTERDVGDLRIGGLEGSLNFII